MEDEIRNTHEWKLAWNPIHSQIHYSSSKIKDIFYAIFNVLNSNTNTNSKTMEIVLETNEK